MGGRDGERERGWGGGEREMIHLHVHIAFVATDILYTLLLLVLFNQKPNFITTHVHLLFPMETGALLRCLTAPGVPQTLAGPACPHQGAPAHTHTHTYTHTHTHSNHKHIHVHVHTVFMLIKRKI